MRIVSRLTASLLLGACACSVVPDASAIDNKEHLTPEDTLRMFEYEIQAETLKRVNKAVDTEQLAKEIGLRPPVMPPTLSREQVKAKVDEEVAAAVERRFPAAYFEQIKRDAVQKHRMYPLNETITIRALDRNGQYAEVTGALRDVQDAGIRIADRWINKEDIANRDQVHFFRAEHNLAVEAYNNAQTRLYESKRETENAKQLKALEWGIYRRYGYVQVRGQGNRRNWIPVSSYYLSRLEKKRQELYDELYGTQEYRIMQREGWKWDDETSTWLSKTAATANPEMTPAEEGSILDKFKRFIDKRDEKKDESIPTLIDQEDDSFNLWGSDGEETSGGADALFDEPAAEKPAKPAAPAAKPQPTDQVDMIFDEG